MTEIPADEGRVRVRTRKDGRHVVKTVDGVHTRAAVLDDDQAERLAEVLLARAESDDEAE